MTRSQLSNLIRKHLGVDPDHVAGEVQIVVTVRALAELAEDIHGAVAADVRRAVHLETPEEAESY